MSTQQRIYLTAKENIGETAWAKKNKRQARRKENVCFNQGEWKCNLFVYEVIYAAGKDIGTPNKLNGWGHPILAMQNKLDRPPCAKDWFNEEVSAAKYIGEGDNGRKKCEQGDIITDGTHMGIVAGNKKTISAGEYEVVHNDWGFRGENVKIFRIKE